MNIIGKVGEYKSFPIKERRVLHQIPETGLDTYQACEELEKVLIEHKVSYRKVLRSRGIIALANSGKPGKCLTIGTNMDALEIKEEANLDFKSHNGLMHAYGHDCHVVDALTTLLALNPIKKEFSGVMKFIFQPEKEYPDGAELMIKEGTLDSPEVGCIIEHHVGGLFTSVPHGGISFRNGNLMASMGEFVIRIEGSGGYGSMPEDTVDPIVCLVDIVQAINGIKSRGISSSEKCVISVCKVNSGINQDVIPPEAEIEGTVKTFNDDVRKYIRRRVGEISEYCSQGNRCSVSYDYTWKYPRLSNNDNIIKLLKKSAKKVFLEDIIYDIESEAMAGDDMAYYPKKVPGVYFMLNDLKMDRNGRTYPNHHPKFDIDEDELYKTATVCVQFVLDYLS